MWSNSTNNNKVAANGVRPGKPVGDAFTRVTVLNYIFTFAIARPDLCVYFVDLVCAFVALCFYRRCEIERFPVVVVYLLLSGVCKKKTNIQRYKWVRATAWFVVASYHFYELPLTQCLLTLQIAVLANAYLVDLIGRTNLVMSQAHSGLQHHLEVPVDSGGACASVDTDDSSVVPSLESDASYESASLVTPIHSEMVEGQHCDAFETPPMNIAIQSTTEVQSSASSGKTTDVAPPAITGWRRDTYLSVFPEDLQLEMQTVLGNNPDCRELAMHWHKFLDVTYALEINHVDKTVCVKPGLSKVNRECLFRRLIEVAHYKCVTFASDSLNDGLLLASALLMPAQSNGTCYLCLFKTDYQLVVRSILGNDPKCCDLIHYSDAFAPHCYNLSVDHKSQQIHVSILDLSGDNRETVINELLSNPDYRCGRDNLKRMVKPLAACVIKLAWHIVKSTGVNLWSFIVWLFSKQRLDASQTHKEPLNLRDSDDAHFASHGGLVLRQYQKEIVEKCANKNTIFTLPTGAGKTAVAAELIRIRIESTRLKAVLFVPTTTLLKQQQHEMKLWLSNEYEVKVLKGGDAYPKEFGVLISTAEAFNNALINRESHAINEFCIMVFDEVHHCKDSHAYSRVMETIKSEMERANVQSPVRFVGMSASLTYEITPKGVAASIEHLKRALNVEKLVTYDIEQLVNMGYKPNERKLLCDFRCVPHNAKAIPVGDRRTDVRSAIYRRIQDRTATPLTLLVYEIVMKVEESCKIVFDDYMELKAETNVSEWPRRATMMVERAKSDSQRSCSRQMEIWWKAFYLLTITWEDKEHLIVHWIKMHQDTYKSDIKSEATRELINDVMRHEQCTLDGHTMFDVLVNKIMSTQTTLTSNGVKMKGLIFVANKLEGLIVADYLASDKDMKSIGIKTKFVAAPKSSSVVKLSKTSVNQTLKDYECGELDLLVTTTLLEEGFNDKGVNAIINLSSIDHTVSLEQRLGRARGQDSSLHLLVEHPNRSINAISDSLRLQKKYISEPMPEVIEARAKQSREAKLKSADEYLSRQTVEQMRREPKAILNAYMAKSNMMVDREIVQTALSNEGMYKVTLTVRSLNLAVEAVGRTKRNTESEAAFEMLREVKSLKLLR